MSSETTSNLNKFGSLNRIQKRSLVETYCNIANLLPAHKRLLFQMYYKHGYSTVEISQLMMLHQTTVARRIAAIGQELTELIQGIQSGQTKISASRLKRLAEINFRKET